MTRQEAKEIALKHCSPLKAFTFDPLSVAAQALQASYDAMASHRMIAALHDLMEERMGVPVEFTNVTRVQDSLIVDMAIKPTLPVERIMVEALCRTHGIEIIPPRSAPLVESV